MPKHIANIKNTFHGVQNFYNILETGDIIKFKSGAFAQIFIRNEKISYSGQEFWGHMNNDIQQKFNDKDYESCIMIVYRPNTNRHLYMPNLFNEKTDISTRKLATGYQIIYKRKHKDTKDEYYQV